MTDIISDRSGFAIRRQLGGRSHRVRCTFAERVSATRARGPIRCTIRVYRTVDGHGQIASRALDVTVVAHRHAFIRRNGTGFATYSAGRTLAVKAAT